MHWKTTLVLVLVTVGIGAYVALYEIKQPTPAERRNLAKQVVRFGSAEVTSLIIDVPETQATLKRRDGAWHLISPLGAKADEVLLSRILSPLDPLISERILESPGPLADYGLSPARGTLTVIAGSQADQLVFGDPTAVGGHRYLKRLDAPQVFVTSSQLFDALNQPLESYRSHELLSFDALAVREIAVTSRDVSYTLSREQDQWQLTAPIVDAADSAKASTIVSRLRGLRIERFIDDSAESQADRAWGFQQPFATITIAVGEGGAPLELVVGSRTAEEKDQRYAKRSNEPGIYGVATDRLGELLEDPQALRSRSCFDFLASQVTVLELTWPETSWKIEKQDGRWEVIDGQAALQASAVEEFLWKLREMKLLRFVKDLAAGGPGASKNLARFGLEPPLGTLRVWTLGQNQPQELLIGETVARGPTRYGRIVGRASVVELPPLIDEILGTTPASFEPSPDGSGAGDAVALGSPHPPFPRAQISRRARRIRCTTVT